MRAIAAACGLALGLAAAGARADVGPAVVAKADLALWSESIATHAGFDRASRAAILVYADALADAGRLSEAAMRARFGRGLGGFGNVGQGGFGGVTHLAVPYWTIISLSSTSRTL